MSELRLCPDSRPGRSSRLSGRLGRAGFRRTAEQADRCRAAVPEPSLTTRRRVTPTALLTRAAGLIIRRPIPTAEDAMPWDDLCCW